MPDEENGDDRPSTGDEPGPNLPQTSASRALELDEGYALTALPSTGARALAFAAVVVAGLCGGLIGFAISDIQCSEGCGAWIALGSIVGALVAAVGVAVVAVLVLRAMSEWNRNAPTTDPDR
jgi:hypothetical protein